MLHQATAVAIAGRALLIEGPPGCGKTSLALALIDRGATLVGDDGVALSVRDGVLWASPAPATIGLIEIRGVGIATLPATEAPVALVLAMADNPPRYVDAAGVEIRAGVAVPALPFDMGMAPSGIRAEYALSLYGLPHPGTR